MSVSYVICRKCGEKIKVRKPTGRTRIEGRVSIGPGVKVEGGRISFGPGGKIGFGLGGRISFGAPAKLKVMCPNCSYESEYDIEQVTEA